MPQDLMQPFKAYLQHQLKGKPFSEVTVGECAAMPEPVKQGYEAEYWRRVTQPETEKRSRGSVLTGYVNGQPVYEAAEDMDGL